MWTGFVIRLSSAWRDRRGTTAIIYGLMFTILVLSAGGAIDIGRWLHARSVSSAALDAAVLAGGRSLQLNPQSESAAIATAQQYYTQNVSGLQLESNTVTFSIADDKKSMSAAGEAFIRTTLLNVAGIDRLPVLGGPGSVFPKAELATGGGGAGSHLEVSLVLDVTGSMCANGIGPCNGGAKMDALKAAAKDLVDIVVSDDQSRYTSRVAVVPFSTRVRVGPDDASSGPLMTALTGLPDRHTGSYWHCTNSSGSGGSEGSGNWTCSNWELRPANNWMIMPCVTDRYYDTTSSMDYTDDAPGAHRWLNAHGGNRYPQSSDSDDATGGPFPDVGWNYSSSPYCADVAEDNEILPLTSNKSHLRDKIDDLEAYGATAGALGTAWGWYMLSPKWSSIWTNDSTPGPYAELTTIQSSGAPLRRKVVVIMSDGVYNTYRGWKGQNQQQMSDHAGQLCTNMKAEGIEVYTVGFALNQLPAGERTIAENTLRSCGTTVDHFYNTLNTDQLRQAFRDIALQMSSLYLAR